MGIRFLIFQCLAPVSPVFNSFTDIIRNVAFIFVHAGRQPVDGRRIYAVAAAVLEPGGGRKTFTSLIDYPRMTARERYASGVSREMTAAAPSAGAVSRQLQAFLDGTPFFMALDDYGVIDELSALSGTARFVDIGFAAEFFVPELRSHTLKSLWEYLTGRERDTVGFSPEEGLDLCIDLARHISGSCLADDHTPYAPVLRRFMARSGTLFGSAWIGLHRRFKDYFGEGVNPSKEFDTADWRRFLERVEKAAEKPKARRPLGRISRENLENLYRDLSASAPGFTYRREQVQFAGHVADALNDAAVLTIEAGTGTGKTLGYLLPAMEYLRLNPGERIVVSTYTKSLQEQLFHNEIAFIRQTLPVYPDIRIVLLKGKTSYVCVEKLDNLYDDALTGEDLLSWLYCLVTAFRFRQAEIGTVGVRIRRYLDAGGRFGRMLRDVSAGSGCPPSHTRCPAQVVTAQAGAADLVITNHHKLALLDRDPLLGGCFDNYIIDEANHFEPAVRNAFALAIHSRDIKAAADGLAHRLRSLPDGMPETNTAAAGITADLQSLREALADFRDGLLSIDSAAARGAVHTLHHDHPVFADDGLRCRVETLHAAVETVVRGFAWVKDDTLFDAANLDRKTRRHMAIHLELLEECAGTLKGIREAVVSENTVTVYRIFRKHWFVAAHPVAVGDLIRRQIYGRKRCIVYTAATLCHRDRFESFRDITGMAPSPTIEEAAAPRTFRFERIPSPFPGDAAEIIVPPGAASGKYDNKAAWVAAVSNALPELIRANQGRTLVLFSSYRDLEQILDNIGGALEALPYPLLVQRPGEPTADLCDEFRAVRESVLLGVDTFWYGVDFKGDTLTQVIITRIPYPPPNDPIQTARKHLLPARDFWERYRYDTNIKMKQGIGRLIRCETDRGKVVVLDSRYRPRRLRPPSIPRLVDAPEGREEKDHPQAEENAVADR
jgi:ATP-dependent DNA helicase DinG